MLNPFSAQNRTKEVRLDESTNIFIRYILYLDFLNPKNRFNVINFYDI
jgi:hypothetical protein